MKKNNKKVDIRKASSAKTIVLAGIIICCILGYYIYNLPAFWVRPATAEFSPEEGKGLYLGMSVPELKDVKGKVSFYKDGKIFVKKIYYDRKIGGQHFDNGHYTFNSYGRLVNLGFSRHLKEDVIEKEKYEYIKYFISKYGTDYKKGICVFKPYSNKRFVYNLFIWEKKDARIVLEFSFYDNSKTGYYCKNQGIYLSIDYPKVSSEGSYSTVIEDPENPEIKETFGFHFPDLEKKVAEPAALEKAK